MTQARTLKKLKQKHWASLENLYKTAYQEGREDGITWSHGQGRRGRTIREDATVEGLIRQIEDHFGLARYGFEVRIVHGRKKKRQVPATDMLKRYRIEE